MSNPTHLSLFSGIGGIDLASEWAGFETVGQCEWADYPTKVLEKHWPDVPRWRDIRTLTQEDFYGRTGRGTVDLISGGFPCQPFSVAGNQKGKDDERYLWPEMLRVIRELTPRWVIGENVPGILHIAAADVVKDLERIGYHVVVFAFEAAAVGARHRRERIFFVANAKHDGLAASEIAGSIGARGNRGQAGTKPTVKSAGRGECDGRECDVADTACKLRKRGGRAWRRNTEPANGDRWATEPGLGGLVDGVSYQVVGHRKPKKSVEDYLAHWEIEPNIPRVAVGIKNRVNRLKADGNAVVPQQVYPILKAIYEIMRGDSSEQCNIRR